LERIITLQQDGTGNKMKDFLHEYVLILDFGSQYTQLIARRVREAGVFCKILPCNTPLEGVDMGGLKAIILSGSPASVTMEHSPQCDRRIFESGLPVLGICYGLHIMTRLLGGEVISSREREFGYAILRVLDESKLLAGVQRETRVWMSHGDSVVKLPAGFRVFASTDNTPFAVIGSPERNFYGVQFHPEVAHTAEGKTIIRNFLFGIAGCRGDWTMKSFMASAIEEIRNSVGDHQVVCAVSGGVDSSVLASLLHKAIGDRAVGIFVDTGLLRKNEAHEVINYLEKVVSINLRHVNAGEEFFHVLKGVTDPEMKRKRIGELFIRVFEREAKKLGDIKFLAQGTLYPDVIESRSVFGGPSAVIKSHHNVGGLPEKMNFQLIEPLKFLFKDEVRILGHELGLPDFVVWRHPFPGPGLAVRIIGEVTEERVKILQEADWIVIDEIKKANLYRHLWQIFAVLLPVQTVGVMGDERTYENMISVRAVTSEDGMTADWARLPYDVLAKISTRIINEVRGVNRVVYDISSKPPSTIEYE
jgi:GMP synthase (glutamine-hydrolysing)